MKLADLTQKAGEWLRGVGPESEVVISSRVRLARNLAGRNFLNRCSQEQVESIEALLRDQVLNLQIDQPLFYVDVNEAGDNDRRLLVERHLISRQLAQGTHPRGVGISADERIAVMVNEEDHLRLQVLRSGLQLEDAVEVIEQLDDKLEEHLTFAYHARYGYLTACPTNVGTGLRVSVMLHLPALKLTGEIEKAFRAARDMHLVFRGLYGEGTEALGDFFQLSNQTTLGKTEKQILEEFRDELVPEFIRYERQARQSLSQRRSLAIDDKVSRALSILTSAKLISSDETMHMLSLLRMGVNLGRIENVDVKTLNELFILTQPAHLQRICGRQMDGAQRAQARAEFIHKRLEEAGL